MMNMKFAFAVFLMVAFINTEVEGKSKADKKAAGEEIERLVAIGQSNDVEMERISKQKDSLDSQLQRMNAKRDSIKAQITRILDDNLPIKRISSRRDYSFSEDEKEMIPKCCPWVIWCCIG
ncbi:uncharacterized protein [Clytia hemisphaerica]|uniref:Uncharacterized protein n=1 Tax=Clytia hemisphaerica TaxID=252671 RepID=A0A7M5ULQ8_9CNID